MDIRRVSVYEDVATLSREAADRWVSLARQSIARTGAFHVALSGGSTPKGLLSCLAEPDRAQRVDWQRVHLYFGDERCVPHDHADSNYKMARLALIDQVEIPSDQVHPMHCDQDPAQGAQDYAQLLLAELPKTPTGAPRFDLVMLGMGPDGHTASLFPNTDILTQRDQLVAAVRVEQLDTWRISLTLPMIETSQHLLFLIAGANKAGVIQEIFADQATLKYPIQLLKPQGQLEWHLDHAAAQQWRGK